MENSKKGSSLVESAIVFPFMILSLIGVIYIIISMFSMVQTIAVMDRSVRAEARAATHTSAAGEEEIDILNQNIYGMHLPFEKKEALVHTQYGDNRFIKTSIDRVDKTSFRVIDEAQFARNANLISRGLYHFGYK